MSFSLVDILLLDCLTWIFFFIFISIFDGKVALNFKLFESLDENLEGDEDDDDDEDDDEDSNNGDESLILFIFRKYPSLVQKSMDRKKIFFS